MADTIPIHEVTTNTAPAASVAPELSGSSPPAGYPMVADFMGEHPTLTMVRRFRGLNARNLLYLQAELVRIERQLLEVEREDARNDATRQHARDYEWLMMSAGTEGDKQWNLIQKMREKLKEYNDVLIQQKTLAQLSSPSGYDAATIAKWYEKETLANMPLEGDDSSILGRPGLSKGSRHMKDLVVISGRSDFDKATIWLAKNFAPNWGDDDIHTLHESNLYRFTAITATALSSLLPVLSIVVLYLVHNMPARLGIVAAFTAAFSVALSTFTSATRVENFATTAAFAAVQVVFVGTTGPASG